MRWNLCAANDITLLMLFLSPSFFQYEWISEAADQLATLAFYVWTAVSFRPHAANPYLKLHTSDNEVEMA